jgi:hypothetical protein
MINLVNTDRMTYSQAENGNTFLDEDHEVDLVATNISKWMMP